MYNAVCDAYQNIIDAYICTYRQILF